MWSVISKLWWALPYDGQGVFPPADSDLTDLRRRAASNFWKRAPRWTRPVLIPLARLGWVAACVRHVWTYARRQQLSPRRAPGLFVDCVRSGAQPNEALIWGQFFAPPHAHPLPGNSASRVLSYVGNPAEQSRLADKHATAELLAKHGLAAPPTLEIIVGGRMMDAGAGIWSRPGHLFVKPRHGSASRGAMAVEVLGTDGFRIAGGPTIGIDALRKRLTSASDDLLVQPRLAASSELADLATRGAAAVLRLTTARNPGEVPFLHSALLSIDVPGEQPRNFIRGQLRVPIDAASGRLGRGIWFLHPGVRFQCLPWNDAPLAERPMPRLDHAVDLVLRAMALFPGLPIVNWDLIVTDSGPVILEGNTSGDWILTNLSAAAGMPTVPLAPLLCRWVEARRD